MTRFPCIVIGAAILTEIIPLVGAQSSIYSFPYPNGLFDGGEFIEQSPTVELPLQQTYANGKYKYAVFLSNDGMVSHTVLEREVGLYFDIRQHQFDYINYVNQFPKSTFATLAKSGVMFSSAKASNPSDSYPGTAAFVAGCSPRTHG